MVAEFASSAGGGLYGRICERYALDPAAGIDDDVMAYNLQVALAVASAVTEEQDAGVAESLAKFDAGKRYLDDGAR